jgi:hypothetical protein
MSDVVDRSHMRGEEPKPVKVEVPRVKKVQRQRESANYASDVIGVNDIVWDSFSDFQGSWAGQSSMGALSSAPEPHSVAGNDTAVIAGKTVKRMPPIDDFADMMRVEDKENHKKLERYTNPLGLVGALDWFRATLLAVMIENGRVGIKDSLFGYRAVYMYRSMTGNPFFRIFGGRMTLLIAAAQWLLIWLGPVVFDEIFYKLEIEPSVGLLYLFMASLIGVLYVYNLIHWRFAKRYSFVIGRTVVDGWKARAFPSATDVRWACGRTAIYAVNLSACTCWLLVSVVLFLGEVGWL